MAAKTEDEWLALIARVNGRDPIDASPEGIERVVASLEAPVGMGGTSSEDSYEKYDRDSQRVAALIRILAARLAIAEAASDREAEAHLSLDRAGIARDGETSPLTLAERIDLVKAGMPEGASR